VKKLCVMTDKNVVTLPGMTTVLDSLQRRAIDFEVYTNVRIEPTDERSIRIYLFKALNSLYCADVPLRNYSLCLYVVQSCSCLAFFRENQTVIMNCARDVMTDNLYQPTKGPFVR